MRIVLTVFFALSISSLSPAWAEEPFTVMPVSGLVITRSAESPFTLDFKFQVFSGGACHTYGAITVSNPESPATAVVLTDTRIPSCESPDVLDFGVSLKVGVASDLTLIQLLNPIYVKFENKP